MSWTGYRINKRGFYCEKTGILLDPLKDPGGTPILYANKEYRLKAKKKRYLERKQMNCYECKTISNIPNVAVSTIPCTEKVLCRAEDHFPSKQKEDNMNTTTSYETERRALRDLLFSLERDKVDEAKKHNHIDPYQPKTYGELKQLLKDGKVTVNPDYKEYEDDDTLEEYMKPSSYLVFDYKKPNRSEYRKTVDKISKEVTKLRTQIAILPPEEALKKLEAFESKSFH